ncbi:uncharacterized protein [Bemisia tabaci]|uniref:uncharacterized protein n=1 Tax=Bemisia tabaci TaxID=7038 RepID=UPI003B282FB3
MVSVHNVNELAKVKKFQYLLTSLKGEALDLVKGLDITDSNYDVAWEILCQRFQCERRHIFHHFNGLLDLPEVKDVQQIPALLTKYREHTQALEGLDHKLSEYSSMLTAVMVQKLNNYFRKRFDDFRGTETKYPTIDSLVDFLEKECLQLDGSAATSTKPKHKQPPSKQTLTASVKPKQNSSQQKCPCCTQDHPIYFCESFLAKSIPERRSFVKEKNLCFNCMKFNHSSSVCKNQYTCKTCHKRHNSLLHLEDTSNQDSSKPPKTAMVSNSKPKEYACILGTALVLVKDSFGGYQPVRGLIDSAAMSTFITKRCAHKLGLKIHKEAPPISGLGNQAVNDIHGTVECEIKSRIESQPVFTSTATIMTKITTDLPNISLPHTMSKPLRTLTLADPEWMKPGPVDLLIGADLYPHIYDGRKIILDENWPIALSSIYGWVMTGKFSASHDATRIAAVTTSESAPITALLSINSEPIETCLRRHWEIEEPPSRPAKSPNDLLAEELFLEKHSRDSDGRYSVPMLLTEEKINLGDSYHLAKNRLIKLEHRLNGNPDFRNAYKDFMKEYEELGHMKQVDKDSIGQGKYYIPHHGIWKQTSTSSKMRVVFDASMKTTSGKALNDVVLKGEKLQTDIIQVLTLFRFPRYVFTADVCKMYRQILVNQEDRPYQRILWREDPSQPIKEYELQTVTYGVTSSPYVCLRTMRQHGDNTGEKYPVAKEILTKKVFVDDILAGADSIQETKHARDEIIECAGECNMELKKWSSNDPEILVDLPESNLKTPVEFSDADSSESLLGLQWQPSSDIFSFKVEKITPVYTKRGIASVVAQIFDPLGLISPIMLKGKQFLQQLWLLGIDWDDAVPLELQAQWKKYTEELIKISEIRIPRHVSLIDGVKFDLVGFSDASKLGYSGNVYLRVESSSGEVKTSLLMAKTKVAPLKPMSIPRLELQGAALLTELLDAAHYICSMAHPIRKVFAYSDSTVVLSWLQTPPYRLKVFVANRVTRILEVLTPQHWGHVKSEDNPSDLASRGCMPDRLADNSLWWHGPKWLQEPEEKWPKLSPFDPESKAEIIDKLPDIVTLVQNKHESWEETFLKSFSGFVPLLRTTVWMLRFIHNTRHPTQKRTGQISSAELQEARHWWIKIIQGKEFKAEIRTLSEKKESPASLCKLRPFLDEQGLLRVGGRLRHSDMSYDFKFPILLPKNHHFTQLVIDYYHDMTLHGGPSSTLAAINQRFWIINGRAVVRSKLQKCIQCFKVRPKFTQPLMGDLPKWRVQAAYPFLNTACDYGGPFQVKENKLRNARQTKGYLALFICMATKAVHLEFVSELTTKAFEGALARFVSRRGLCKNMFSDNGTNFVGMNNSLKELYAFLKTNETSIAENLSKKEINWHFQPASAPNFGGLHEAGIKSAKHHLKRIMSTQIFTFEEMTTLVTRVEAIMNSRPLCPLSTDPSDMDALTPGHFLVGRPLNALPEENLTKTPSNRVDRWGLINKASQHFWQTWKNEYINCLRQRSKWTQETDPIKIDDLVIIQDNNLPPQQWRLGRITKCFPGPDDVTRVVDVKTTTGTLRRPVSKLCRLPIGSDKDQ